MNIRNFIYSILSFFNCATFKTNKILIYGGNYLDDNSEAIFRYLIENTDYKIICLADSIMTYPLRANVKVKKCSYFNAIISMLTSKVLVDSSYHTIKMKPTKKQLFIQCWHGSPLKYMSPSATINNSIYYSKMYYAAEIFKEHMQSYFRAKDSQMLCSGSPRNDYLFTKTCLPKQYIFNGKSVIWMPTFRHGIGRAESNIDIPVITNDNIDTLDKKLEQLNIRLYIKPHRLQIGGFQNIITNNHKNIILLTDSDLKSNNIPLYSFLSSMDALLTDYSSVFYDYLLINRPIGFVIDDYEQYKRNRGFAFDSPLTLMPGEKIYNINDLISFLCNVASGKDEYVEERHRVNLICNTYADNNCKRCVDMMKEYLK